jgi:hypothetical protein
MQLHAPVHKEITPVHLNRRLGSSLNVVVKRKILPCRESNSDRSARLLGYCRTYNLPLSCLNRTYFCSRSSKITWYPRGCVDIWTTNIQYEILRHISAVCLVVYKLIMSSGTISCIPRSFLSRNISITPKTYFRTRKYMLHFTKLDS